MEDLHALAQRLPNLRSFAGLEKHEVLEMLSNHDVQSALEAMLSRILGRPLQWNSDDPDLNGGVMISMMLITLSDRSFFTQETMSNRLREQAGKFTAEYMRIVDAVALPGETVSEHVGEFVQVYQATQLVFNPWMKNEAMGIISEIVDRLERMAVLDQPSLFMEHKLITMRERHVTPSLAARLAPFTASALQRTEQKMATVENPEEHARLRRITELYSAKLAFYSRVAESAAA